MNLSFIAIIIVSDSLKMSQKIVLIYGTIILVLFKGADEFKDITYIFTKAVMENIGTLRVLASCVPVSDNKLNNYKSDYEDLYKKHRINESQESNIAPWSCLPIVQVDRKTSQPLVDYENIFETTAASKKWDEKQKKKILETIRTKGDHGKLSKEAFAKLLKYHSEIYRIKNQNSYKESDLTKIEWNYFRNNVDKLDDLVEQKGVDSNLAVVYIDGNSMGKKLEESTSGKKTYEESVKAIRKFSKTTQETYVDDGVKNAFENISDDYRLVVSAGDEINFIVKAKDAFSCARDYLDYLKNLKTKDGASACAGIAVFNSHAPYADAYRIAEEACESGKQKMKKNKLDCASFIDFHICQGAIGTSLEDIREEENGKIISRPWMMWGNGKKAETENDITDFASCVEKVIEFLRAFSRSNIKGMANAAKCGEVELKMEINRTYAHAKKDVRKQWEETYNWITSEINKNPDKFRGLFFDISIAYDFWFSGKDNLTIKDEEEDHGEREA